MSVAMSSISLGAAQMQGVPAWGIGPFQRPDNAQPIIKPGAATFDCPMRKKPIAWEKLHTFNPAAIVKDGKVYMLYRAEDDTGTMTIGGHTSRLGLAVSDDGIHFTKLGKPVVFPAEDAQKENEWDGGCEDPRLAEGPDGTYVLTYTQYNRKHTWLAVATSKDLVTWTKHGPAFPEAGNGKYKNLGTKSGAIVHQVKGGRLIAAKIDGKYWMYFGVNNIHLAHSEDLIKWTPVEDAQGKLLIVLPKREGMMDSNLTEGGPPPILTENGIVVLHNAMNSSDPKKKDPKLNPDIYTAGQALFDARNPARLIERTDEPFFGPELAWEKTGQYERGTTFIEGLVLFKGRWFLYYGCADSFVGVAFTPALPVLGPLHGDCRGGGPGHVGWFDGTPPTEPQMVWSVTAWVKPEGTIRKRTLVAGFGDGLDFSGSQRFFAADENGWFFFVGSQQILDWLGRPSHPDALLPEDVNHGRLDSGKAVQAGQWQHLAATYDGATLRFYVDGVEAVAKDIPLGRAAMQALIAPAPPWKDGGCFAGKVAQLQVWQGSLTAEEIKAISAKPQIVENAVFTPAPPGATPEGREGPYIGRRSARNPQDPQSMPQPIPTHVTMQRKPKLAKKPAPELRSEKELVLNRGWELAAAEDVALRAAATGDRIASPGYHTKKWHDATVPGTVLTTLVEQGVYPNPLHGLNNLLIPDALSRKSWWYRVEFDVPASWEGQRKQLVFKGVNFHYEVWLNGKRLGEETGAFIRPVFDVTDHLKKGEKNVLAVRVWPQPHNGMTHEESPSAGVGPNGADGVLDGPTFICAEGWDWIPTIRDRCTGIWQDVVLQAKGVVALGEPRVVTTLPKLPDLSQADVRVETELRNLTGQAQKVTVEGEVAGAKFTQQVELAAGEVKTVVADSTVFPQLSIQHPKLWWPNGYGEPALHDMTLRVVDSTGAESDVLHKRIGLRTVAYDTDPHLTVLVNGQMVMCKGGNWGLDDALKRISKDRLEPFIRLHREANVTIIRDWCGQSTSDEFYELCDQYGIMVWKDFWMSTTDHDLPPIDAELLLNNAEDVVRRIRNHPSIVLWCGRNEGPPPWWIDQRLGAMLKKVDGTRMYLPSSWDHPVMGGGPYQYVEPAEYFQVSAKKPFTTELGVNSIPVADYFKDFLEPGDLWPRSDAWNYHDSHDAHKSPYFAAIEKRYGKTDDFEQYIRQAQMINYENHRAMFEGWNARLWNGASGVMIWMSHSCWPSTVWQMYGNDYSTHASFFGVQKACEPLHVQWSAHDDSVQVINNTFQARAGTTVTVSRWSLAGKKLEERTEKVSAPANAATLVTKMQWSISEAAPVEFVQLTWRDAGGVVLSDNFYWHAAKTEDFQSLRLLPRVKLEGKVTREAAGGETVCMVEVKNSSAQPAVMVEVVLRDAATGRRILPAYACANYISLLPGESRRITVKTPLRETPLKMTVAGWNVEAASWEVAGR